MVWTFLDLSRQNLNKRKYTLPSRKMFPFLLFIFAKKEYLYWFEDKHRIVTHGRYQCNYFLSNRTFLFRLQFQFYPISSIASTFYSFLCRISFLSEVNFVANVCIQDSLIEKRRGRRRQSSSTRGLSILKKAHITSSFPPYLSSGETFRLTLTSVNIFIISFHPPNSVPLIRTIWRYRPLVGIGFYQK